MTETEQKIINYNSCLLMVEDRIEKKRKELYILLKEKEKYLKQIMLLKETTNV